MCCLAEFIIKYVLIISNIIFSIAGLAIAGLGIAVHIQLEQIATAIPVDLSALSIGIIVLGCIVFMIAYLACCGAIRESNCMLISYALFMAILAAVKIYITVVVFKFLDTANNTVAGWINDAFNDNNLNDVFNVIQELFRCCGTTGANSYPNEIPNTCCGNPLGVACAANDSYDGCTNLVAEWFQTFGGAIGAVLIIIIIVELVCMLFGLVMAKSIRGNKRRQIA